MATNEVYRDADHLSLPVPTGTKSGDPVAVGSLMGVAQTDRRADGTASVWLKGAYELTVDGEVTAVGTPVHIVADGSRQSTLAVASPASDGAVFGHVLATKTAAAAAVPVRVAQV